MRAFLSAACFWVGAVVLTLLGVGVVWAGLSSIYVAGQNSARTQPFGPPTCCTAMQFAPAAVAPAPVPVPQQIAVPVERLTLEVKPDGTCAIGIDVPSDVETRRKFLHQRKELGLGPC